jgi:hypothetical protein
VLESPKQRTVRSGVVISDGLSSLLELPRIMGIITAGNHA